MGTVNTSREDPSREDTRAMVIAMLDASNGLMNIAYWRPALIIEASIAVDTLHEQWHGQEDTQIDPDLLSKVREQALDIRICLGFLERMAVGTTPACCMFCRTKLGMNVQGPDDQIPDGLVVLRAPEPIMRANVGKFAALATAVCQSCAEGRELPADALKFWEGIIGDDAVIIQMRDMPSQMVH